MSNPFFVKSIVCRDVLFSLFLIDLKPVVKVEANSYHQIWVLAHANPFLHDPAALPYFCEIANFLWKGGDFELIDSIPLFQMDYNKRILFEQTHQADLLPYRVTDYALFDLSSMHSPKIEESSALFFVYNKATGIPYRVVCPFPYTAVSTFVHYQLLPFASSLSQSH